jgi:phosphotransferase family enzyme
LLAVDRTPHYGLTVLDWIATATGARAARRGGRIQTLWSGYGEIFRVALDGGIAPTAIIKHVTPPHTRGSISDARKRRSYDVEAAFYRELAPRCDDSCRVARMYASRVTDDEWTFVLEDLDAAGFSERRDDAEGSSLDACLGWLAAFHARFLGEQPAGLWPTGTYWHLATRLDELAAITDRGLRERARDLDAQLSAARFQTILHGDPKEANFCFSRDGRAVAAVDFQYAGRGCAMKDVAYLLHGRDDRRDQASLDTYFRSLRPLLAEDAPAIEAEWRALFPIARLDFRRFLAGWRG